MRFALQLEHRRSLREPQREFDLEWNWPSDQRREDNVSKAIPSE
jgi:hypothetical protein